MSIAEHTKYKVSPPDPAMLRHADVEQHLEKLRNLRPSAISVRMLGASVEGRPIRLVTLGTGPRRVLMWSQMHGDEPTHTAVLLDLIALLQATPHEEPARTILAGCMLMVSLLERQLSAASGGKAKLGAFLKCTVITVAFSFMCLPVLM